ncbi:DUF2955 domain-containing protein [Silvimonas sp.]|uniref:DUF2955 domain-containing protein n=1 Tax=Silvimonas sp. TaxID=2650811 RepID=UPI002849E3C4|nr:DUF2955 domain-containing protein [Silvimonas sp.]MDR3428678.1 DUF2955 domain-containing protein [Silvimonas sp.]
MFIDSTMRRFAIDQPSRFVLRFGLGGGLALAAAYGMALAVPHVSLLIAMLLLSKPGPALSPVKSIVLAGVLILLMGSGVLLVPLLQHYAVAAVLLIALGLFAIFYVGTRKSHPLLSLLIVTFTLIPVAGIQEQALALAVVHALAGGVILGAAIGTLMHVVLPNLRVLAPPKPVKPDVEAAVWLALRGVIIILPVLILALQNPSLYMAAIMKTATLGQQAESLHAKEAGRELLGSTFLGALLALLVWCGLSLWPSLWMYTLWMTLAFCWLGLRLYRIHPSSYPPSFWMNTMITLVIFLGPAVQDSANGKDVLTAALIRLALFAGIALYAWGAIYVLEQGRMRLRPTLKRTGV